MSSAAPLLVLAACSGGDSSNPSPPPAVPSMELLAGTAEGPPVPNSGGFPCCIVDGRGSNAAFAALDLMAADASGTLYASDGAKWIRKITPAGDVTTLIQMAGETTGVAIEGVNVLAGEWNLPCIVVPPFGTCPPTGPQDTIWRFAPDGTRSIVASVSHARGITRDVAGNVWWTEASVVRRVTASGDVQTIAVSTDLGDLWGVAVDNSFNAYVASRNKHVIYKVTAAGDISVLAGSAGEPGDADGTGSAARFNIPNGIKIDSLGNLYVADLGNNLIRKITAQGAVTTIAGTRGAQGFVPGPLPGMLVSPADVALVGEDLYIDMYKGIAVIRHRP